MIRLFSIVLSRLLLSVTANGFRCRTTLGCLILSLAIIQSEQGIMAQGRQGKALDSDDVISISSKQGILYNGIDNILRVDPSLYIEADTLLVTINNGIIISDTCNKYLCIPSNIGTLWLTIFSVKGNDTLMLGYKYFPVVNIPDPLLTLNSRPIKTPAFISKNELLDCDSLGVYFSDDILGSEHWMVVSEFSLGYSYGGFYVSHNNPSSKFTTETREIINRLGPDREISIRPTLRSRGNIFKSVPIYRIRIY
jgi:hypothetical protein